MLATTESVDAPVDCEPFADEPEDEHAAVPMRSIAATAMAEPRLMRDHAPCLPLGCSTLGRCSTEGDVGSDDDDNHMVGSSLFFLYFFDATSVDFPRGTRRPASPLSVLDRSSDHPHYTLMGTVINNSVSTIRTGSGTGTGCKGNGGIADDGGHRAPHPCQLAVIQE